MQQISVFGPFKFSQNIRSAVRPTLFLGAPVKLLNLLILIPVLRPRDQSRSSLWPYSEVSTTAQKCRSVNFKSVNSIYASVIIFSKETCSLEIIFFFFFLWTSRILGEKVTVNDTKKNTKKDKKYAKKFRIVHSHELSCMHFAKSGFSNE